MPESSSSSIKLWVLGGALAFAIPIMAYLTAGYVTNVNDRLKDYELFKLQSEKRVSLLERQATESTEQMKSLNHKMDILLMWGQRSSGKRPKDGTDDGY